MLAIPAWMVEAAASALSWGGERAAQAPWGGGGGEGGLAWFVGSAKCKWGTSSGSPHVVWASQKCTVDRAGPLGHRLSTAAYRGRARLILLWEGVGGGGRERGSQQEGEAEKEREGGRRESEGRRKERREESVWMAVTVRGACPPSLFLPPSTISSPHPKWSPCAGPRLSMQVLSDPHKDHTLSPSLARPQAQAHYLGLSTPGSPWA